MNSKNVTVSDVELSVIASTYYHPFRIISSHTVTFDKIYAHGDVSAPPSSKGGIYVDHSDHIWITHSVFSKLEEGILNSGSSQLHENNNIFMNMASDGIDSSEINNSVFSGNVFKSFETVQPNHPDGIHIYTQGTTSPTYNVTIYGNLIYRGNGNAFQGIFLKDEVGTLPYVSIRIVNNTTVGTLYNGISVDHANTLIISGNKIGRFSDYLARIIIIDSNNITESNNVAPIYLYTSNTDLRATNNQIIPVLTDGGAALISSWLAGHPTFYTDLPTFAPTGG